VFVFYSFFSVVSRPSGYSCGDKPYFVDPTLPNDQKTVIPVGITWKTTIRAKPNSLSARCVQS